MIGSIIGMCMLAVCPAQSADDPLTLVAAAHRLEPGYRVEAVDFADAFDLLPARAQELYDRAPGASRREALSGRGNLVALMHWRWEGGAGERLAVSRWSVGRAGPIERATTLKVWGPAAVAEGIAASRAPRIVQRFTPSSLVEDARIWESGRVPVSRTRAMEGGYIELVRYALRVLARDADARRTVENNVLEARSDVWRLFLRASLPDGQVISVRIGLGPSTPVCQYFDFSGSLGGPLFPATHPRYQLAGQYTPADPGRWWEVPEPHDSPSLREFTRAERLEGDEPIVPAWVGMGDPTPFDESVGTSARVPTTRVNRPRPAFEPSATNPGRTIPTRAGSPARNVLLAAGVACALMGAALLFRRRFG